MLDLACWGPKGALMPATTPEQIHRLFEEAFNAGDLDSLMELHEPDAALIAQPGSVARGGEQVAGRAAGLHGPQGPRHTGHQAGGHRRRPVTSSSCSWLVRPSSRSLSVRS